MFFADLAESHTINNISLNVIVDSDQLEQRQKKEYDGISVGEILYFIKAEDYGELPEVGTPQIFDGRQMQVFDAKEDMGIYEIILTQNRGY